MNKQAERILLNFSGPYGIFTARQQKHSLIEAFITPLQIIFKQKCECQTFGELQTSRIKTKGSSIWVTPQHHLICVMQLPCVCNIVVV